MNHNLKNKCRLYLKGILMILILGSWVKINAQETASKTASIAANDSKIIISGSNYVKMEDNELVIHRHADEIYNNTTKENLFNPIKARTSSGIMLEFKTSSPNVVVNFKIIDGLDKASIFSVFQNNIFIKNLRFKYEANSDVALQLESQHKGEYVVYKITFPIKTDVHFLGLELEEGYNLETINEEKKGTYVAFGDSITHGTGQKTTPETYAFQLAKKMEYELFNLAVGGGKTSQVMAEMIRDDFKDIDMMTIFIGFNDYNGEGVDTDTYAKRYKNVIETIREKHPTTKLYCITLTHTKAKQSKKSQIPADDFRAVVRTIVSNKQKEGDNNIFLINGEEITTENSLKDAVHFSIDGARDFANELYKIIKL